MSKVKIMIIFVVLILFSFGFYKIAIEDKRVDPALESVASMPGLTCKEADPTDTIGVKTYKDVNYVNKDDKVVIYYGKLEFYVFKNSIKEKDVSRLLKRVFIKIVKDDDSGEIHVYYKGKEVSECVK